MNIVTSDGIKVFALPDCATCNAAGKRIEDMDKCPCNIANDFGCTCIPDICEHYDEPRNYNFWERNVPICPLHSDNDVMEYCVEGPCMDWLEGRCPIMERSEE